MGGKRKSTQKVPYYYMTLHYGVCHGPIDSINQLWIKEKLVLCAEITEPAIIYLNRPDLFGGETKEGGVAGAVEVYFGTHDQRLTQPSAARFNRTSDTMVAYRGVASLFFRGTEDSERGDYPIATAGDSVATPLGPGGSFGGALWSLIESISGTAGETGAAFAGFFARTLASATALYEEAAEGITAGGGFYWLTNNPYLPAAWAHVTRISRPFGLPGAAWERIQPPPDEEGRRVGLFPTGESGTASVQVDVTAYAAGIDAGMATINMSFLTSVSATNPVYNSINMSTEVRFYDEDGTLIDFEYEQSFHDGGGSEPLTRPVPVGTRRIDMVGIGTLFFPVFANWRSDGASWELIYGANGRLLCPGSGMSGSPFDANPAYIIAECLTNRQWGMGHPISGLDEASFLSAAETLFNEHFGLSMIWNEQATIEKFVSEVLDHIQATLFLDPRTGLWTLKLIRFDYDIGTLRTLNAQNSKATNRQRKAEGEIINEIVISYKDFQTEENKTVTYHDLAGVAQLGEIVSDTRNYYGIRSDYLAGFVGARDIRSASYPLFTCEIEANRSFSDVRPGDVLKLDVPEDGLVGMVVRIAKVDYGQPGDSKVRFNVTEDIFALEATEFRSVQPSLWVNPDSPPAPLTRQRVVDVPLPLLYRSGFAEADLTDDRYPEVVTGLFGDDPLQDISVITVWGDYVSPSGEASQRVIGSINRTPSTILPADLAWEAESTFPGARLRAMLDSADPESGDFLYIDGTNEGGEVVMIDAYDDVLDEWTLSRGMFDTVPKAWPTGQLVWYLGSSLTTFDPTMNVAGVPTEFKLLPTNSSGTLLEVLAPVIEYTPSERPYLPFRPADCQIDGLSFAEAHYDPLTGGGIPTDIELTWLNRNRLQEDGLAARWTEPTVTPEAGQTTTIRVRERATQDIVLEHTGLTGTSYTMDVTGLVEYRFYDVEFISERDGFESLQWVTLGLDIERLGYGANYDYDYDQNDGD